MSANSGTPLNLRGQGDHPEIGVRVDGKGIAFDTATGRSLGRGEVDARVATFQRANPGVQVAGLVKKRGGVARVWDNNKKIITPVAEIGAGLLGGPAASAALGAAMRGLDRPGKSGVGLDVGQALRGGVEGGLLGYGAGKVASAVGSQGLLGAARSGVTKLGSLARTAGGTLLGGSDGVASGGDLLKAGLGLIPAVESYNRAKGFEKTANTQLENASSGNATMAEIAKALIARGAAPSGGPDLSNLIDTRNPYAKALRPQIATPAVDLTTGPAGTPPGASVAGASSGMLGAQSSGMVRGAMPQGQTMASLMEMARNNAPKPPALATPTEVRGAMPAGQTMSSLLEMARQNAPKPPPGDASSVMGALPPGASAGGMVQGAPPPGMTLASILGGIKSPVQPPAAPAPQSGMMGGLPAGTSIAGFKPEGAAIKSWGTEPGGAMSGMMGRLPTPPAASVAATPNPYSLGGAKPWTVADAKSSGSVPGAFPTSVPNFDPKTGHEIKSWDTEAPRKRRPKPVGGQELLPSPAGEY